MINLKQIHKRKVRGTRQQLIEGMVETLLDHSYSVNEIQELLTVPYLAEVKKSCMNIFDAKGDIIF